MSTIPIIKSRDPIPFETERRNLVDHIVDYLVTIYLDRKGSRAWIELMGLISFSTSFILLPQCALSALGCYFGTVSPGILGLCLFCLLSMIFSFHILYSLKRRFEEIDKELVVIKRIEELIEELAHVKRDLEKSDKQLLWTELALADSGALLATFNRHYSKKQGNGHGNN